MNGYDRVSSSRVSSSPLRNELTKFESSFPGLEGGPIVSVNDKDRDVVPLLADAGRSMQTIMGDIEDRCLESRRKLEDARRQRENIEAKFESVTQQIMAALEEAERLQGMSQEQIAAQHKKMFDTLTQQAQTARQDIEQRTANAHEQTRKHLAEEQRMREQMKRDLLEHHTVEFERHKREYESAVRDHRSEHEKSMEDLRQHMDTELNRNGAEVARKFEGHSRDQQQVHERLVDDAKTLSNTQDQHEERIRQVGETHALHVRTLTEHTANTERGFEEFQTNMNTKLDREIAQERIAREKMAVEIAAEHGIMLDQHTDRYNQHFGGIMSGHEAFVASHEETSNQLTEKFRGHARDHHQRTGSMLEAERQARQQDSQNYADLINKERQEREEMHRDIGGQHKELISKEARRYDGMFAERRTVTEGLERMVADGHMELRGELQKLQAHGENLGSTLTQHAQTLHQDTRDGHARVHNEHIVLHKEFEQKVKEATEGFHKFNRMNEMLHKEHQLARDDMERRHNLKHQELETNDMEDDKMHNDHRTAREIMEDKLRLLEGGLDAHVKNIERCLLDEAEAREKLGRRITEAQNEIALEQLDRVDKLLGSEKRLCSPLLLQQAKEQTDLFLREEMKKIRMELGLPAVAPLAVR